uniref:Major facilitator superfamily (MFS) profile domain-containing protein n=1 Tax=Glossina brevipalpis TaxID=37001 RepID=A0A1A9WUI3_9MUSC
MKAIEQTEFGIAISKYFIIPQRVITSIMGFLAIVTGYSQRVCLSMAITQMVVPKSAVRTIREDDIICPQDADKPPMTGGDYEWTEEQQGRILSFFYIGYLIGHIPGGMLGDYFGFKWVLAGGLLWSVITVFLTPPTVYLTEHIGLAILRIFTGLGQAVVFPNLSVMLSHWVPKHERGKLGALIMGGGQVGTVLAFTLSGIILHSLKWPMVFYIFGIIGLTWCAIFVVLCYSDPVTHPFIKPSEREYLVAELGSHIERKVLPPTPWTAIFTSPKIYALLSAQIGHDWGFYILITYLPKYYNDVLNINIKENGFYATFPFIAMWISSIAHGAVADFLIKKEYMNITNVRKMMTSLGNYRTQIYEAIGSLTLPIAFLAAVGPAIFLILGSYAGCHKALVITYFTCSLLTMGGYYAGMKLTPIDLSPNYSGTIMAISNGTGALFGVVSPYLVGVLTPNATLKEWRVVFWLAFAVLILTAVAYCIWASGEVQEWNDPDVYYENKAARKEAKRLAKEAKKQAELEAQKAQN